jgi:hypothetical protein
MTSNSIFKSVANLALDEQLTSNRRQSVASKFRARLKSVGEHVFSVMLKKVLRVALLLTTGYNSTTSQRKSDTVTAYCDLLFILANCH